jgi:DNA-binding response OmpR family regulator
MINRVCVMIVEADILVRHPLAEYLRDCGFRVIEAFNAGEARLLLNAGESFIDVDIVLVDANTPGQSGFELAAWIRGSHPKIEVILAGSVAKAAAKAGDLCQDGPALSKPYEHKVVLGHIQRLIAARDRGKRGD